MNRMELGEVHELIDAVAAFDSAVASLDDARQTLASLIRDRSSFPENDIGNATRTSQRTAASALKRAGTTELVPELANALKCGIVTAGHVDAATRALAQVKPEERKPLASRVAKLIPLAEKGTPEQFEKAVRREIEAATSGDGEDRLARQRGQARVRTWTDSTTGMWHLHGEFDPETGLSLHARIEAMLAAKFAETVPDGCPADPSAKQDWLRAQAVIAIFNGDRGRSGGAETVVVVDTRSGDVRWPLDVTLPDSAVQRFVSWSKVRFVDVHGTVIASAPGDLNLGRTTRLANAAQRRALRVLYPTCAVPGCCVRYEYTKAHHVHWWRNGGRTDLANLLPLCARHHQNVHAHLLVLHLAPDRTLTVTGPDGTTMTTGPPRETAA
jgi:hypothetical protein